MAKNILFLDNVLEGSVFEKLNAQYLEGLSKLSQYKFFCAVPHNYEGCLKNINIELIELDFKSKVDFSAIKLLIKIVRENSIDIVHCHNNRVLANSVIATYFLNSKPKIICRRGIVRKLNIFDPSEWITYLNPNYTHTIALSKAIEQDLLGVSNVPSDRVTQIYQAIGEKGFNLNDVEPLRDKFDIPKNEVIFCTVANYRKIKGLEYLIESFNLPIFQNSHLFVVGQGCHDALFEKVKNKNIRFLGFQEHPERLVSQSDIYIQPSLMEGLCFSVIEAMLLKKPVIVSDVGGMSELVIDGETGYKVLPGSSDALTRPLKELISNERKRVAMGKKAFDFANETFSLNVMVQKTEKLYEKLLEDFDNRDL